jgi:hypothetical protein
MMMNKKMKKFIKNFMFGADVFIMAANGRVFAKSGTSLNVQPGTNAQLKNFC